MTDSTQIGLSDQILSTLAVAVLVWRLDDPQDAMSLRLVYANPAAEVMTGVPLQSLVGRTLRDDFPRAQADERVDALVEVALGGAARDLGDSLPIDVGPEKGTYAIRLTPLTDRRVAVVCKDVTQQREAEDEALGILDAMSDLFSSFDRDLRYTFINAEGERIAGRTRAQMIGQRLTEVYPGVESTQMYREFLEATRSGEPVVFEEYFDFSENWVSFRVYPTPDGIAVFAQDITAQKRLDENIIQTQKMRAVATLAGGIAHDFNNALTAIRVAAQLGLTEDDQAAMREDLEQIDLVAERATSLTKQMLTISRAEPSDVGPTSVNEVIRSMEDLLTKVIGESVTVSFDLQADHDNVLLGADELQQVLLDLCINARDAMPDGGEIRVSTSLEEYNEWRESGAEVSHADFIALRITDTGAGMGQEVLSRAFEPFFTTKEAGTGLGLASVHAIANRVGGQAVLASQPGAGTTVRVLLPTSPFGEPANASADGAPDREFAAAGATVLVVEDDEAILSLVVRALQRSGMNVLQASSGAEAMRVAEDFGGPIDLLLSDVLMPGMGGGELAACLRLAQPAIRVLFMSGHAADVLVQKGVRDSDADFLAKPFRVDVLLSAIQTALASHQR